MYRQNQYVEPPEYKKPLTDKRWFQESSVAALMTTATLLINGFNILNQSFGWKLLGIAFFSLFIIFFLYLHKFCKDQLLW